MSNFIEIRALDRADIPFITEAFNSVGWSKPASLFEGYLREAEACERLVWVAFINRHDRWSAEVPSSPVIASVARQSILSVEISVTLAKHNGLPCQNFVFPRNDELRRDHHVSPRPPRDDGFEFAGYITLKLQSQYPSFKEQNIPEIKDLNVLPSLRKSGMGSMLLEITEKAAVTKGDIVGIGVGLYAGADGGYGAAQRLYVNRGYIPDGKGVTYNYAYAEPGEKYPLDDDLLLWFTKRLF